MRFIRAMPVPRSKSLTIAIAVSCAAIAGGALLWFRSGPSGPPPPASSTGIDETTLPGVPASFADSLEIARKNGARGLREWMRQHEKRCLDPRLGWIQLEYSVLVRDSKPDEAKVYFEMVKSRTPTNSPIMPRIVQLEPYFR